MPAQQPLSELTVKPPTSSKDFQTPIHDEWKRKVVDEAKKRAVGQASDYETFKNLVSVAHLRPIGDPSCKQEAISTPAARLGCDGQVLHFDGNAHLPPVSITSGKLPTTTAEFNREWKRNRTTNRSRFELLCQLAPSELVKMFKVELNSMVLSEIITACEECWQGDANIVDGACPGDSSDENQATCIIISAIIDRLQALMQSKGFGMASKLLSSRTKSTLQILIHRLMATARSVSLMGIEDSQGLLKSVGEIAHTFGVEVCHVQTA